MSEVPCHDILQGAHVYSGLDVSNSTGADLQQIWLT